MAAKVVELDEVYDTLAARLTAGAPEYTVAPWAGAMFTETDSGAVTPYSHHTYTIDLPVSRWPDGIRVAARSVRGAIETHTDVVIRWVSGLTLDDPTSSYRQAIQSEYRTVQALRTPAPIEAAGDVTGRAMRVRVTECARRVVDHVWMVHLLSLTIDHTMTLQGA